MKPSALLHPKRSSRLIPALTRSTPLLAVTRSAPLLAVAIACATGLACATAHDHPPPRPYPGTLTRPSEHPGDFVRRQKLSAKFGDQTQGFEAVLQKQGDQLKLVGLTPFGTKAFLLEQDGLEVKFTSYMPRELPFPPRYILQDVHRVYFGGLGKGALVPLPDGEHTAQRDGETIAETWRDGRLLERRFTRVAADPPGVITVVYEGGMAGPTSPKVIRIDNGWLGYQLVIETVSEQKL